MESQNCIRASRTFKFANSFHYCENSTVTPKKSTIEHFIRNIAFEQSVVCILKSTGHMTKIAVMPLYGKNVSWSLHTFYFYIGDMLESH